MKEDRMPGPLIVRTRASSGIGMALAGTFAREGNALLLTARHMEPLPDVPDQVVYVKQTVADLSRSMW
jgi:short-subunit dehydrogenase